MTASNYRQTLALNSKAAVARIPRSASEKRVNTLFSFDAVSGRQTSIAIFPPLTVQYESRDL